jgi:anthranilate synthase component 1
MKISQENFANHHGEISPPELYQVLRAKFGQPCGILESMSFDESNKMSLLVANPRQKITPNKDVFAEIKKALEKCSALPTEEDFPFAGGLIGWLNYETVQEVEPILQSKFSQEKNKPLAIFMEFETFVFFDHQNENIICLQTGEQKIVWKDLISQAKKSTALCRGIDLPLLKSSDLVDFSQFSCDTSLQEHEQNFQILKDKIFAGEFFQIVSSVNFSLEFFHASFQIVLSFSTH